MRLLLKFILFLTALASPQFMNADDSGDPIVLPVDEEPIDPPFYRGNRMPSRKTMCMIDPTNGVSIGAIKADDIYCYEVFNLDGSFVLDTTDMTLFIEFIYQAEGEFMCWFITEDKVFKGCLEL